jgi:PAS domain-containing protein
MSDTNMPSALSQNADTPSAPAQDANTPSTLSQPATALADLHRRALDRLHHAVMIVGLDYKILYANNAMCQYIGLVTRQFWTTADLIGRDVMTLHPDQAVPGSERRFREMSADGFLKPRTNPIEDLLFLTWDSRILDDEGRLVAFVLEKVPATFNPDPLPARYSSALEKIRGTMAEERGKRT